MPLFPNDADDDANNGESDEVLLVSERFTDIQSASMKNALKLQDLREKRVNLASQG